MRQIKVVKSVKNPQTGQTEVYVPLLIQPTISKYGQGAERFQWIMGAIINGQYVKLCYLTDNQLLDFADRIKEAVLEKRFAISIMGEQFVENRINQLYAQKQQAQMPAQQPVQQPVNQPAPQPVNQPAPMPQPKPVNVPDIQTV